MTNTFRSVKLCRKTGINAFVVAFLASLLLLSFVAEAIPTPGSGIVLRVRLADGSMQKLQLEAGSEETLTLGEVLKPLGVPSDASLRIGTTKTDTQQDLKTLELKNGSMVTVLPPKSSKPPSQQQASSSSSSFASRKAKKREWDPYPDLAKDYESVVRKTKTKRLSYGDISKIQSSLHIVDPQKEGPITRLYMCRVSAERFYSNGVRKGTKQKPKATFETRLGLLLGTINKERVDQRPKKARTSLSSTTSDSEYCTVAKIQAVWEPPGQKSMPLATPTKENTNKRANTESGTIYDASMATSSLLAQNPKVLAIAKCLGLAPVGWIYSYKDDRLEEENSFGTDGPQALFGLDVAVGGKLKIEAMKEKQSSSSRTIEPKSSGDAKDDLNDTGDKFVTLAMDATTGATEAFQLSDVSVQMVHENIFENLLEPLTDTTKKISNPPTIPTKHPVLVDGQETKLLDSVLCLVNTAVLSHVGSYSGSATSGSATKKSNGALTNKTKKLLLKALDSPDSGDFLKEVCDFNILLALDEMLGVTSTKKKAPEGVICEDTKDLCKLVKKWARGQKKGTVIDPKFKMKLKTYLS